MKNISKIAAGLTALAVAASLPFAISAEKATLSKVGGYPTRVITDFEALNGKTVGSCDELFGTGSEAGVDFGVKSGYGINGSNALVMGNVSADNLFAEASYNPSADAAAKNDGLANASDFVCYVNTGGETAIEPAFQVVIGEWDYDKSGNPVMKKNNDTGNMENALTFWKPADSVDTKYYTLADGETDWSEHSGTFMGYVKLPIGFKGYVRIPLSEFDPTWQSKDQNDKFDLKHITRISFYYGMYNRHVETGYAIAVDNIGFCGNDLSDDNFSDDTTITDTGKKDESLIPATGDNTARFAALAVSSAILAMGIAAIIVSKRKEQE